MNVSFFYSIDDQLVDSVFLNDTEDVRMLLSQDADPDARDEENRTVLSIAVADGSNELVRLLLEAGANPNLRDDDGLTALDIAVYRRRLDLAWMLVKFGAGTNARDAGLESTLWRAGLFSVDAPGIHELLSRSTVCSNRSRSAAVAAN